MSCDFFERHFCAGAPPEALEVHRASCAECAALSAEFVRLAGLESRLTAPSPSAAIDARWRRIPRQTTDCDTASELTARAVDEVLTPSERRRWEGHVARCAACRETAEVLGTISSLRLPEPAVRPTRPRPAGEVVSLSAVRAARRGAWADPRLYAAAACLLAGFFALFANTLDLRATAQALGRQVRVRYAEASDRFQIWEDGASRTLVATRESLTGYTRAVGAIALSAAGRATEGLFRNEPKTEKGNKS